MSGISKVPRLVGPLQQLQALLNETLGEGRLLLRRLGFFGPDPARATQEKDGQIEGCWPVEPGIGRQGLTDGECEIELFSFKQRLHAQGTQDADPSRGARAAAISKSAAMLLRSPILFWAKPRPV